MQSASKLICNQNLKVIYGGTAEEVFTYDSQLSKSEQNWNRSVSTHTKRSGYQVEVLISNYLGEVKKSNTFFVGTSATPSPTTTASFQTETVDAATEDTPEINSKTTTKVTVTLTPGTGDTASTLQPTQIATLDVNAGANSINTMSATVAAAVVATLMAALMGY